MPPSDATTDYSLTSEEKQAFERDGFIGPFTLYEPDEIRSKWKEIRGQVLDKTDAAYGAYDADSAATNISNYDRDLDVSFLAEHIKRREIVDRVNSILGRDLLCWRTEFFPKYKGDEGTDWHQASTFANASGKPQIVWPEGEADNLGGTLTVWTAFTDSTLKNGCLQLMPGTHRELYYDETKGMSYDPDTVNSVVKNGVRRGFFGYDYRQLQKDPNWQPDEREAFPVVMQAGQFLIFWSTLLHASLPHTSTLQDMRLGFASRYIPTRVKVYPGTEAVTEYGGTIGLEKYGTVLVSGEDRYQYNRILDV